MARPKATRGLREAVAPSNSLVASAVRYPGKVPRIHPVVNNGWQSECYRHFAICGEARAAASFFGHAMSRAVLGISEKDNTGKTAVQETGSAVDLLDELFNGPDGQAQMLEALGVHLTIAGECYLVGRTVKMMDEFGAIVAEEDLWEVLSVMEVKTVGDTWYVCYGGEYADIPLDEDDTVIRIWRPNPVRRMEAESPFKSLLPILTEIEWLTRHIFAQTSSRLAGAGILLMPSGITFPQPPEVEGKDMSEVDDATKFMLTLGDAMMVAIKDPSSPSSLVPIIVTAPGEEIQYARLLTFWTELDANSKDLRTEAIQRFAAGMDLPNEQILGMSSNNGTGGGNSNGVSHWGAWQIEEATIKMHIEPMLGLVCNALTISYIRPMTDGNEFVTYNTASLRLRPDRSKEAMELWSAGGLSTAAMLRENGFDPDDLPDDEELKKWFLKKIASGSATPQQVEAALEELGISLNSARFEPLPDQPEPRESRPDPTPAPEQRPRTPGEELPNAAALIAASEGLVFRALEKAGNRVLNANKRGKDKTSSVNPCEAHMRLDEPINGEGPALLADAFKYAPQVLSGIVDSAIVVPVLERYCLALFATQLPHSRERMIEALSMEGVL